MLFKNPIRTSKRTPHFTITKINWLTLFKEIIIVYSENHTKQTVVLLIVKAGGTYNYHSALKGKTVTPGVTKWNRDCQSNTNKDIRL
jgi:hypothetical protein